MLFCFQGRIEVKQQEKKTSQMNCKMFVTIVVANTGNHMGKEQDSSSVSSLYMILFVVCYLLCNTIFIWYLSRQTSRTLLKIIKHTFYEMRKIYYNEMFKLDSDETKQPKERMIRLHQLQLSPCASQFWVFQTCIIKVFVIHEWMSIPCLIKLNIYN